jgi:hypothetical protein
MDVVLFGRLKSTEKYLPRNDTDPAEIDYLVRIFKGHAMVTTSTTVRASWMKAGFEYRKRDDAFDGLVNDGKIRDAPEFSEMPRSFPRIGASTLRLRRYRPQGDTKKGIYEPALFQRSIGEDSEARRARLNNPNMTSHDCCRIAQIAKFPIKYRNLIL